ncbi:O-antigen ligase family protein [Winogradskyella echinorum]|uniref:O-antigen ligase family protein n=1 Tax=Winogradskyella echinorum TaxID=538189 RepID=A0ABR6XZ32_9FLAO|nr:O-antigen ligase family protein [Winogradskyella echinorum]MBC3845736.1 O-antigen ligase family protein [Winogradskyella echinorum]MBC5750084.1 O-antigen ligase family protein [Winogradskyella echinorum]
MTQENLNKAKSWSAQFLYLSTLSLSLFPILKENYGSITIIIFGLALLIYSIINKEKVQFKFKYLYLTIPFIIVFCNLLFSNGILDHSIILQKNVSFLLIPILFGFFPRELNVRNILNRSLDVFTIACCLLAIYYFYEFLKSNEINYLFSIDNSYQSLFRASVYEIPLSGIHPTYSSMFFLFSFTHNSIKFFQGSYYRIIFLAICGFMIFMLSAKGVLILLAITVVICVFTLLKVTIFKRVLIFIFFSIIFGTLIFCIPTVKARVDEIYNEYNSELKGLYTTATNIRLAVFKCSIELAKENYISGVGLENIQEELNNCYKNNYDSDFYLKSKYDTHNYYLYILISTGILGIVLFLFYLFKVLNYTLETRSLLFFLFVLQIFLINFVENFMYRHHGQIFWNWYLCLFVLSLHNYKKEIK